MEMHIAQPMRMAFLKNGGSLQWLQDAAASSWVVGSVSMSLIFFFVVFLNERLIEGGVQSFFEFWFAFESHVLLLDFSVLED